MSNNSNPAPVNNDEGENTPQTEKKSLWARAKARKARFVNDHPFAAAGPCRAAGAPGSLRPSDREGRRKGS